MTCATLRILAENILENATLTSRATISSEFDVNNITNSARESTARYDLSEPVVIDANFSPTVVNELRLLQSNLSGSGTVSLILYDGANQTGNITYQNDDITVDGLIPMGVFRWGIDPWNTPAEEYGGGTTGDTISPDRYALSARITITDLTNPDNALDIGHLMLGQGYSFDRNYDWGLQDQQRGSSTIEYFASGGAIDVDINDEESKQLSLSNMTRADYLNLREMERKQKGKPWHFDLAPEETGAVREIGKILAIVEPIAFISVSTEIWSANLSIRKT